MKKSKAKARQLSKGFALPKSEPKRTKVDPKDAEAFETTAAKPSPKPSAPKEGSRRRDPDAFGGLERLAVYIPGESMTALRVYCATHRRSISDAVTEALTMWLQTHGNTAK